MQLIAIKPKTASWLGPAGMLFISLLAVPLLALKPPLAGTQRAVLFAPGTGAADAMRRLALLDARLVRRGGAEGIYVARFKAAVPWPRLLRHGVWLSFDPLAMGGCFVSTNNRPIGL